MPRPLRPCLDCKEPTRNPRGRCRPCQQRHDHQRNAQPTRQAYKDPAYKRIRDRVRAGAYGPCTMCGTTDDLTVDHIRPLSQGGTNDPSNLRVLCRSCNSAWRRWSNSETRAPDAS